MPVTGTTPYGAGCCRVVTRVDANTVKVVGKRNGKVILTPDARTSADGKTRTVTTKGTNAKGEAIETASVYDKQ